MLVGVDPHISVSMSNAFGDTYRPLRCSICGNVVCGYNNSYIRSITPSGVPIRANPGVVVECSGVLRLHGQVQPYNILTDLLAKIFEATTVEAIRACVADLARDQKVNNIKCKAKYYLS